MSEDVEREIESSDSEYVSSSEEEEVESLAFADSLLAEIRSGTYTCLVCTGEIDSDSQVWSCHMCYRVYDLDCIRDWAKRGSSTGADKSWRCPSCNGKHTKLPKDYRCWCGKTSNPQSNVFRPHSCGQTCNVDLETCIHQCSLECHPGPHIKRCTALGPAQRCNCGDQVRQVPCTVTPYESGWQCGKVCGDILPCGLHRCDRVCHKGPCGPCPEDVSTKCFCGKHTEQIQCSDRNPKKSVSDGDAWIGTFQCSDVCRHSFDCGNHVCMKPCHPYYISCHKCPLSPEVVTHCACGKCKIAELLKSPRESCLDPIPTCGQVCDKPLPCGHRCIDTCHEGECGPCLQVLEMKCSCEYSAFMVPCAFQASGSTPKCAHKCQALLSCRRHRCGDTCCAFEKDALKRDREIQKGRRRVGGISSSALQEMVNNIEAKHLCTKECGKLLSCGLHRCEMTCHLGPCRPCLESSSDDLVCNCGKTVVPAPVRCGTVLPQCTHQCVRPTACGHRPEYHTCHPDSVSCPKCTFRVTKKCGCDKQIEMPNVMCFQEQVSCGRMCGKLLPCGAHKCTKLCHGPGQCLTKCPFKCGKLKDCGHMCTDLCHAPSACRAPILCNEKVIIYCKCKRLSKHILCSSPQNGTVLECDGECARLERNRNLLAALNLRSSTPMAAPELSESIPYSEYVLQTYKEQKKWCLNIEKTLQELVRGDLQRNSFNFPPMRSPQRQFIHEMAESYKLMSESHDPEPNRTVFVAVKPSSETPTMTLEEASALKDRILKQKPVANTGSEFYNAIAIQYVFFGVTRTAIDEASRPILAKHKAIEDPTTKWINDTTFVLYPDGQHQLPTQELEAELAVVASEIEPVLQKASIAFSCALCKIDSTGTTIYDLQKTDKSEKTAEKTADDTTELAEKPSEKTENSKSDYNWY